jgi:broad specificity phosphatase PhoE
MRLLLVRHGHAAAGVEELDPGLDELGRQQAHAAALALRGSGAKRLVVSPLRRARETAEPIARTLELPAEVCGEVSEVFEPDWSVAERQARLLPLLSGSWNEQSPALRAWRGRLLECLTGLAASPCIVVSHFVAISAAIGAANGSDLVCSAPLPNASITRLALKGQKLVLLEAGSVAHLAANQVSAQRRPR